MARQSTHLVCEDRTTGHSWRHLRMLWRRMRALKAPMGGVECMVAGTWDQLLDDLCNLNSVWRATALSKVDEIVGGLESKDAKKALAESRTFARESTQRGGKAAHKLSKGPREAAEPDSLSVAVTGSAAHQLMPLAPEAEDNLHEIPVVGVDALAKLLNDRSHYSQDPTRMGGPNDACQWDVGEHVLPAIEREDLVSTCKRYADSCGLGWGQLHPSVVLLLPPSYQDRPIDIL